MHWMGIGGYRGSKFGETSFVVGREKHELSRRFSPLPPFSSRRGQAGHEVRPHRGAVRGGGITIAMGWRSVLHSSPPPPLSYRIIRPHDRLNRLFPRMYAVSWRNRVSSGVNGRTTILPLLPTTGRTTSWQRGATRRCVRSFGPSSLVGRCEDVVELPRPCATSANHLACGAARRRDGEKEKPDQERNAMNLSPTAAGLAVEVDLMAIGRCNEVQQKKDGWH